MKLLTRLYRRALKSALGHRKATLLICVCALVAALSFVPTLRIQMMTGGGDDSVTVNLRLPVGTKLSETTAALSQLEQIIRDEVKGYKTLITTAGSSTSSYSGSIQIQLPPSEEQIDTAEVIQQKLRAHFADFPADVRLSFRQGMARQMAGSDLVLKVRSDSLDQALQVAAQIESVMNAIPDIGEPTVDTEEGLPEVEVVIDRQRAYAFGVDVTTVAKEINYAINGVTATTYRENGKEYSVKVMYQNDDKQKMADLEQIFVKGTNGKVSVANFAEIKKGLGPVSVKRENQTRIVKVSADVLSDKNVSVVEEELKEAIAGSFILPEGVTVSYEGSLKDMKKQGSAYFKIILMAILLVFGVMAGTYESFKEPFINLFTLPFLIVGAVLIHLLTGSSFSMVSMIGVVMLIGIVVNNGIILVDQTNLLVHRGVPLLEACESAGASRFRPVMMTTLSTLLGMVPMAFFGDANSSMTQPIGLCVIGGLTSSTIVTLFIIPVIYSLFNQKADKKQKFAMDRALQERLQTVQARQQAKEGGAE